ncbi:hypothetical protein D9M68_890090 [compost metagenome]
MRAGGVKSGADEIVTAGLCKMSPISGAVAFALTVTSRSGVTPPRSEAATVAAAAAAALEPRPDVELRTPRETWLRG